MAEAKEDSDYWGRIVESAVGASLVNGLREQDVEVFHWSSRNREVDFVLSRGDSLVSTAVRKRNPGRCSGLKYF